MFGRDKLQYMVFMSMKSTAPMLSDVPVGASLKIKLLGFVEALWLYLARAALQCKWLREGVDV